MPITRPKAHQIDFDKTNITDPLVRINSGQAGTNDKDIGIVLERGSDTNVAIIWDESTDEFVLANTTEDGTTSGNVTIDSYVDLQIGALTVSGSILPTANTTYDIGSSSMRFNDIYLAGNTVDIGGTKISKDDNGDIDIKDSSNNRKTIRAAAIELVDTSGKKIKIERDVTSGKMKTRKYDSSGNAETDSDDVVEVSEDKTPQLGGDLDVNGNGIISSSNGNITITPNGTGVIKLSGNSWPSGYGTSGQVLQTNGSGTLSWVDQSGGGGSVSDDLRGSSSTTDKYWGNAHDYIFADADVGLRFYTAGAEDMRLTDSGDLHVDGNVVAYSTTISDEKLKDNIHIVDNAIDKIKQLKGVTFTYKHDGKQSAGVIAQDVEKVLPTAITETTMPMISESDETYKAVQYDQLFAITIEAIKQQQETIEQLKNEIKILKENINGTSE